MDSLQAVPRFAVVACSACRRPWAVELRHASAACPACQAPADLAARTRLWAGDDAREAQAAVARHRALLAGGLAGLAAASEPRARPAARHDSRADAAAAQAAGLVNKSARAEAVALWMTRLSPGGLVAHADLMEAFAKADLAPDRAEKEVVRLLATDVMVEPRAGHYRVLDA